MYRTFSCILLAVALIVAGCGRSKTYTGPNGEKMTISDKGGDMEFSLTGKNGEKVQVSTNRKGVSLPNDFPKDAPVYPGATIVQSLKMKEGFSIMLKSADSTEKIKQYYEKTLKEQGWDIENAMNMEQVTMLHSKKENRTLTVSITSGNETTVQLMVSQD